MKKWTIVLILAVMTVLVYAHAPRVDNAVYDPATRILTITMWHDVSATQVKDVARHHVRDTTITVNGKQSVMQSFDTQETPQGDVLVYKLLVKTGDTVRIDANCSLAGSANREIRIP